MIEFIGISAGVLIMGSLIFPSTSTKGNITMRILNILGSILFVIYGFLIPAYSTAIVNMLTIILNTYNIIKLLRINKTNSGR
ncbi:MAG: YgjV family protein [Acholeplasmatales bacterium]|nr:YgjV family protein [Acholeplasmatales bacterium]